MHGHRNLKLTNKIYMNIDITRLLLGRKWERPETCREIRRYKDVKYLNYRKDKEAER
jgi:hypothetical protein